jgi:hypothetical protein
MNGSADSSHLVAGQEFVPHREPRDVSGAAGRHVPIPGDLMCIALIQNGIEDRLFGQPRRKPAKPGIGDQFELFGPDWPEENGGPCHA